MTRLSVIVLGGEPSASVRQALTDDATVEVVAVRGAFGGLAPAFDEAVARCTGEFIFPLTPDSEVAEGAWAAIAAAADEDPDAAAFAVNLAGLAPDPAWRGRRCRSHERNLESLRFASLVPPGAFVVRRQALIDAGPLPPGADWWRELTRRVARATRIVPVAATVGRQRRLEGEPPVPSFAPPPPRPHVLVFGQIEVSTSLYFDFLEASTDIAVAFRAPTRLAVDAPHLAAADLVVLVRTLHRFWDEGVIAFLKAAGVPWVYFTDDNFQALAAERDAPTFFTAARMRRALAGAAEAWASTPALAEALAPLHPAMRAWGPVLDPALAVQASRRGEPLTVAIAGGDFRVGGLAGAPVRQLAAIAERQPLRVIATPAIVRALSPRLSGAEIVTQPIERSFRQFIRQWRRYGIDILLHPAGATANAAYKCPTAVLTAGYLGALPIVADEPAYQGWGEAEGVVRFGGDGEGLAAAARRVADAARRDEMRGRLAAALTARFGDEGRADRLHALMRPGRADAAKILASPGFTGRRAALDVAHATRRIRDLAWPPR
ncbi:MAG TPA: glycosyltransferase [Caulobacteraceae bacterium]|nr:glycosyltransferase [Caulobacteraceae bacterium]